MGIVVHHGSRCVLTPSQIEWLLAYRGEAEDEVSDEESEDEVSNEESDDESDDKSDIESSLPLATILASAANPAEACPRHRSQNQELRATVVQL